MQTRLTLWGEVEAIGNVLTAIYLDEPTAKIHIYALPKEKVTKEIQEALSVDWKNGGEYVFPEFAIHWEVDAHNDTILPEEVKVHRPEIILQTQHIWSKRLMSARINQLLLEEIHWIAEKVAAATAYDQELWEKAKAQWEKVASYHKKSEISGEQLVALKDHINVLFDTLKGLRKVSHEQDEAVHKAVIQQAEQQLEELRSRLIYTDQWRNIFEDLKKMQSFVKAAAFGWGQKRKLLDAINSVFDELKRYRTTATISKTKERVIQLSKILQGLKDSIAKDQESLNLQIEKMQHYTRGKLSVEEIKSRFGSLADRIKEKEKKIEGITQTLAQLKQEMKTEQPKGKGK